MNPLFQAMNSGAPAARPANPLGNVQNLVRMLRSGNPQQMAENLLRQNPQFRQFMEENKGKDPMQVAREHGLDLSRFMR